MLKRFLKPSLKPSLKPFFPPLLALATARNSCMAYRLFGPAEGEPWLVLHGGPGSGSPPDSAGIFQLTRQRVIVPDRNEGEILEIPEHERAELEFIYVDRIERALDAALGG